VVRFELERRPRVIADFDTDGDERRLVVWLAGRHDYWALISQALDLQAEEPAA
jgi:hypothetical protein